MSKIELKPTEKKDHYILLVDGINVFCEQERSFYRHFVEVVDNGINTGL